MSKTALLVAILSAQGLAAQSSTARIQITGRISKMGSLSLAGTSREIVPLSGGLGSRQVHVALRSDTPNRTITVLLIARSNAPYRLLVKSAQPLRVALSSVTSNAGSTRLAPDAMNVHSIPGQLAGFDEVSVVEGSGISAAGTDSTPDNAIRVAIDVELPDSISEADLTFT